MSRYTDADRARIFAESRRLLSNEPPPPPEQPAREPPPLIIESEADRWRREANEAIAQRAAADAERRAEERATKDVRAADWWAAIDAHIERRLAEHHKQFAELADASAAFGDAVSARLQELETLVTKLDGTLAKMRALDDERRTVLDMPSPLIRKER